MSGLVDRIVERRRASAGRRLGPPPQNGSDPAAPESPPAQPSLRERARIRRRVRYLRKLRELQLRDLGGFALEQRRLGGERPDLMRLKLDATADTDRELRGLERALAERRSIRELREPGIGGACRSCGTVHGSSDRYCSWCGRRL